MSRKSRRICQKCGAKKMARLYQEGGHQFSFCGACHRKFERRLHRERKKKDPLRMSSTVQAWPGLYDPREKNRAAALSDEKKQHLFAEFEAKEKNKR